jgi:hypothetical protein
MADYVACQMTGDLGMMEMRSVLAEPMIRYAMQGYAPGGALETWISVRTPDYRRSTHTDSAILTRWCTYP